jgi:type IV secretion system protein VirB1
VGIAQVDTENFPAFGLTPENAFDACTNLHAGAAILQDSYDKALRHGLRGQQALFHAFEAYNSGQLWGDSSYANTVLRSAGIPVYVRSSGKMEFRRLAYVLSWSAPIQPANHPAGSPEIPVAAAALSVNTSKVPDGTHAVQALPPTSAPAPSPTPPSAPNGAAYVLHWG